MDAIGQKIKEEFAVQQRAKVAKRTIAEPVSQKSEAALMPQESEIARRICCPEPCLYTVFVSFGEPLAQEKLRFAHPPDGPAKAMEIFSMIRASSRESFVAGDVGKRQNLLRAMGRDTQMSLHLINFILLLGW